MALSSIRGQIPSVYDNISHINQCLQSVRRNAPFTWSGQRHLSSSKNWTKSSYELPNRDGNIDGRALSVKTLLKAYGFSDTQLSKLLKKAPYIFKLRTTNIKLKLMFFGSIGLSSALIPPLVLRNAYILSSSLQKQILPTYNYLKNVPLCDEKILKAARYYPNIFLANLKLVLGPNIELLRKIGLPPSSITSMVVLHARGLCRNHETFKTSVDQAVAMGLDPLKKTFLLACSVICTLTKETWARKVNVYRSFGLSEDELLRAFRKQPAIMMLSEKNIMKSMEFFLNDLHWTPAHLARFPGFLLLDLERRVIPRCHVMKMLEGRGLVPKWSTSTLMICSEKRFLNCFINSYKDELPEIMDIYTSLRSPPQNRDDCPINSE